MKRVRGTSQTGTERDRVRVLFLNTRSALGADVAVHLTLIRNFNPEDVDVFVATNRHSVDLAATMKQLSALPRERVLVADLGHEVSTGGMAGPLGKAARLSRNLPAFATLLRVAGLVRRERIQIVHSTDRPRDALFAALLCRLTGCRHVLHAHINWSGGFGRTTDWAISHAAAVLTISEFSRHTFEQGGIPGRRLRMSRNATDPELFDPALARAGVFRKRLGVSGDCPLIGIVARVMVWKGHRELIEALARVRKHVPNVQLAIIGNEDRLAAGGVAGFADELRSRIRELDLESRVHWAGWCDNVPEVLRDLDVVAMPSWEEPFGLAVTEAMAMERPVVGYRSGALPEILTDGVEGRLVTPKDIEALAGALSELLLDPERRKEMGAAGRRRVKAHFTPRRQADEVAAIYRQLLEPAGR